MNTFRTVLAAGLCLLWVASARANAPQLINYQGRLLNASGQPLDATVSMAFMIYRDSVGSASVWTETHPSVKVTSGSFDVLLGSVNPIPDTVFRDTLRYLGQTVGGDPEMKPRSRLVAVPYTYQAIHSDSAGFAANTTQSIHSDSAGFAANAALLEGKDTTAFARAVHSHVITSADIANGTILFEDFAQNGAAPEQVIKWNGSTWIASNETSVGGNGWIDEGAVIRLETSTDKIGIGTSAPEAKLDVVGDVIASGKGTFGPGNINSGENAFVAGGSNTVSGGHSTVGGGYTNIASGQGATIGGGYSNHAPGKFSVVSGGASNLIPASPDGDYATISGGQNNIAGNCCAVGGGFRNSSLSNYSVIGGGQNNFASEYSVIGGGWKNWAMGNSSTIGGGESNSATGRWSVVGGGVTDSASGILSTIAGGEHNRAGGIFSAIGGGTSSTADGLMATVAGGGENRADGEAATVAGGKQNRAEGLSSTVGGGYGSNAYESYSTVAGGNSNFAVGQYAVVSGGNSNTASGQLAVVPGGGYNAAGGISSFAAGYRAAADHVGCFVWSDFFDFGFHSTTPNEFSARATGGVRFVSGIDGSGNPTAGVTLSSGGGSWASLSDKNLKENFVPSNGHDILEKVAALPISTWNYLAQHPSIRHIGPMAQDFKTSFGVGEDDKHITTVDADGVALAAIQALYQRNKELETTVTSLQRQIAEIQARLADVHK